MPLVRFTDGDALRAWTLARRAAGQTVGLTPTMGALHAGHLSLVRAARAECDLTAATIFVNPTQFGPGEDLDRYPRNLEQDIALLESAGCDAVFCPAVETMYPPGAATRIEVGPAGSVLEGAIRPTHFSGVATIVLKLLNLAPANYAYFGQKDYQQTVVVRQMTRDLNVPIEVRICPTVREPDGLAMSSRNVYLQGEYRRQALTLHHALQAAQHAYAAGERNAARLRRAMEAVFAGEPQVEPQYAVLLHDGGVEEAHGELTGPTVAAVAAKVGPTRLIDNQLLSPGEPPA
ncbi:Pantoate-beta-alanine ligase [Pirellulimonas nuda]|uniref:Pantothenate synthetase n=1 Tax=Pirellulimonas nuda TaxID=2528009 RepID=A0A518D6L6_9BACT|nr:pantoate--beta-alanine ligase [Pirellulimonas nuda]QDU87096.1 Pantoate-beta-alanine ligase [Pirellulimonas nuda]